MRINTTVDKVIKLICWAMFPQTLYVMAGGDDVLVILAVSWGTVALIMAMFYSKMPSH